MCVTPWTLEAEWAATTPKGGSHPCLHTLLSFFPSMPQGSGPMARRHLDGRSYYPAAVPCRRCYLHRRRQCQRAASRRRWGNRIHVWQSAGWQRSSAIWRADCVLHPQYVSHGHRLLARSKVHQSPPQRQRHLRRPQLPRSRCQRCVPRISVAWFAVTVMCQPNGSIHGPRCVHACMHVLRHICV
jgi:hypothetical protein